MCFSNGLDACCGGTIFVVNLSRFRLIMVCANFVLNCQQTTLTALGEMFEAARSIMGWLGDCAKVCPLRFPSFSLILKFTCISL